MICEDGILIEEDVEIDSIKELTPDEVTESINLWYIACYQVEEAISVYRTCQR